MNTVSVLKKDRYNTLQVIIIVISIIVYVFLNRFDLITEEGWRNFVIYVSFNVGVAIAGQKVGSWKEAIRRFQSILDGPGSAEAKLNEAEYNMKAAAAQAGIAWEKYNREIDKKIVKKKTKKKKED